MNLAKKLTNLFLTSGISKEEYVLIEKEINENNRDILSVLTAVATAFLLAMTFAVTFFNEFNNYGKYLLSLLLISLVLLGVFWIGCKGKSVTQMVMYLFIGFALLGSIAVNGLFLFPLMLIMIPLVFNDRPIRMIVVICAFSVWNIVFAHTSESTYDTYKTTVTLVCTAISVVLALWVSNLRCKKLYDDYLTEIKGKRDELTGLFNRMAFKEAAASFKKKKSSNLSLVCLDVDGLKITNDSMGHDAGDEMLKGAAGCIVEAFGNDGVCCRLGGDEFVVILDRDKSTVSTLCRNFDEVLERWTGVRIKKLHVSYGCVFAADFPEASFDEMTKFADMKLYENKEAFYASNGIDRKKQQQAYNLICDTFDRILLANLTDNTYETVKTAAVEMDPDTSSAKTLCEWFEEYVDEGQVCEEDIAYFKKNTDIEFLKEFFKAGNVYYSLNYRRNCNGVVNDAIMHMIPSKEYTADKQMLFVYVNIDGK